jgi:ATP-dependent Clp protease ATP-binding subunit ClpC
MYERFTDQARKVIQLAKEEAERLNYEYLGTEHILLALLKEDSGVAANLLKRRNIDLDKIRMEIEKLAASSPHVVPLAELRQTPRVKKVIENAEEEARNFNHNCVSTEHILLGLLREEYGVAAQILMNAGLTLHEVREDVANPLGENTTPRKTGGPSTKSRPLDDLGCELPDMPFQAFMAVLELDARIEHVTRDKEAAVAEADFEKAALLRDQRDKLKKERADIIRQWRTTTEE